MPRFDFRCSTCQTVFEAAISFGSKKTPACPACGSKKTEKLLTPPGIVFKGSGWYKTDSRAPAKETKTPATKSEAKPEKKSTASAEGCG